MHTLGQPSAVNESLPCVRFFHLFSGIDVTAEEGMRRTASCWARGEAPWYMIMEGQMQSKAQAMAELHLVLWLLTDYESAKYMPCPT